MVKSRERSLARPEANQSEPFFSSLHLNSLSNRSRQIWRNLSFSDLRKMYPGVGLFLVHNQIRSADPQNQNHNISPAGTWKLQDLYAMAFQENYTTLQHICPRTVLLQPANRPRLPDQQMLGHGVGAKSAALLLPLRLSYICLVELN